MTLVLNPQVNATEFRQQVGRIRASVLVPLHNLLITLLRESQEESERNAEVVFCWDWDMIRNYMYSDSPRELYGSALSAMIEMSKDGSAKVIILEGARKEMQRFLLDKARRYRRSRLYVEVTGEENRSKIAEKGRNGSSPWKPIEQSVEVLLDYAGIRRLDSLLADHAMVVSDFRPRLGHLRPAQLKLSQVYSDALKTLGARYGFRRNEADAMNMAQVSSVQGDGVPTRLITGTNELLKSFPDLTSDPFTSLVSTLIHVRLPDPEQRVTTLRRWLTRVGELMERCSTTEAAVAGYTRPLSPTQLMPMIKVLSRLREEPVLLQLSDILHNASVMCRANLEQLPGPTKPIAVERLPTASLRTIEHSISNMLAANFLVDKASLADIGMAWTLVDCEGEFQRWSLKRPQDGHEVLVLETTGKLVSTSWSIDMTLGDFIGSLETLLNGKHVPRPKFVRLEALYDDYCIDGVDIDFEGRWSLRGRLAQKDVRLTRWRLVTDRGIAYYEPGDQSLERGPTAAVVEAENDFRWTVALNQETCPEYLPPDLLKRDLSVRTGVKI